MSRKRRRQRAERAPPVAAAAPLPIGGRRRRAGLLLLGATLLVLLVVFTLRRRGAERTGEAAALALPPLPAPDTTTTFVDFLGSDACAECHEQEFYTWQASTHGRAGGAGTASLLIRAFDGRPIRFRDATVTPVHDGGSYAFRVAREGRALQHLTVDGIVGGGHMLGGGTQGFVSRSEDGTVRFLPFELERAGGRWFCNTSTRLDSGWLPITDQMRLADCGDWPPVRALGTHARFASCQECHGSQIEVAPQADRPSSTRYRSLTINCESCHGPGRSHVQAMRAPAAERADIGMRALGTLDKNASLAVCFRCHALKDALAPGYLPGRPFAEYYSLLLPLLGDDEPVLPDGRIRTFAYQQGHLWSDCYLNGGMTCTDCHDPHSQQYRDANGRPLPGRFDDRQCTACHPSKAVDIATHTRHRADSPGSRCVACHMPWLQEPDVGTHIRYARSDHTIPVPRPGFDASLGLEVACAACHRDRTTAMLQQQAQAWWGELKPHTPLVRRLVAARAGGAAAAPDSLLAAWDTVHRAAEFTALATVVRLQLRPDMPALEPFIAGRLRQAARSVDPDIAGLGLAALHYARANDPDVRRFLLERADSLGDAARAVRLRWAVILGFLGDRHREHGEWDSAIGTYRKSLAAQPDRSGTLLNLGLAYAGQGDANSAQTAYLAAIRADSSNTLARVNLGILLAARGDAEGAVRTYREAMRVDPYDALPYFNLGNLLLRAGRAAEAAEQYQRAVRLAPGLAQAHFNLARAHIALGEPDAARAALRDGLEFAADSAAAQALRELSAQQRTGGR